MNRATRGMILLAAALGLLSCTGDPTGDLRSGIDHLVATPSAIFVSPNSIKLVQVEAVDGQGNRVGTSFSLGAIGGGITVIPDDSFNLVFDNNGKLIPPTNWTRIRYIVTGVTNAANSDFVVTAGGKSLTIPVRILPDSVPGTALSNVTPNVGDTVSITAPTNFRFSSTSVVTNGTAPIATLGKSADSSQIIFVVGPGATNAVQVSNLVVQYAPAVGGYTLTSTNTVTTTATLPALTVSPTVGVAGDTITVTAPAPWKFDTNSVPTVVGAGSARVSISADSSILKFLIGPSATGNVSVTKLLVSGAGALGRFTLNTGAVTLSTPPVPNFPGTFSTATPAGFPNIDTVTITSGAGFKFLPNATVSIGGTAALVVSHAADSLSMRFIPVLGAAPAVATVNGVVLSFLTTVSLSLPTVATIAPVTPSGAKVLATAPTIVIPATGVTTITTDAGQLASAAECGNIGNHCLFYKIVLAGPRTFKTTLTWGNTADIGGYFIDAAGNDQFGDFACDSFGSGAGGQPESCSETLPAGTWYLALADFTAAAQNTGIVKITLLGQ